MKRTHDTSSQHMVPRSNVRTTPSLKTSFQKPWPLCNKLLLLVVITALLFTWWCFKNWYKTELNTIDVPPPGIVLPQEFLSRTIFHLMPMGDSITQGFEPCPVCNSFSLLVSVFTSFFSLSHTESLFGDY
jgi:hypothetical protein